MVSSAPCVVIHNPLLVNAIIRLGVAGSTKMLWIEGSSAPTCASVPRAMFATEPQEAPLSLETYIPEPAHARKRPSPAATRLTGAWALAGNPKALGGNFTDTT